MQSTEPSPPTDDVREAVRFLLHTGGVNQDGAQDADLLTSELFAAFEVRPRGTVTDAEVEAAGRVMYERWDDWDETDEMATALRSLVRTALEAARQARS